MTAKSRPADLQPPKMLRDGRMAGMGKPHRGDRPGTERQVGAVSAKQTQSPELPALCGAVYLLRAHKKETFLAPTRRWLDEQSAYGSMVVNKNGGGECERRRADGS